MLKFVLTTLAVYFASTAVASQEFPLTSRPINQYTGFYSYGAPATFTGQSPSSLKDEPKPTSPLYGAFEIGPSRLQFRFDRSEGQRGSIDRLIVDLNRNDDLTNDPVLKPTTPRDSPQVIFEPFEWKGQNGLPQKFQTVFSDQSANLQTQTVFTVSVSTGGEPVELVFIDSNCDGMISAIKPVKWQPGTMICWGQGDLVGPAMKPPAMDRPASIGSLISIHGELFSIKMNNTGSAVMLDPFEGPVGELMVNPGSGLRRITFGRRTVGNQWEPFRGQTNEAGVIALPAGEYVPAEFSTTLGTGAEEIRLDGFFETPKGIIEVKPSGTVALNIGAPFLISAEVAPKSVYEIKANTSMTSMFASAQTESAKGHVKEVEISAKMTGAGGETYGAPISSNGRTLEAPEFKVTDASGKVLESGKLEYG